MDILIKALLNRQIDSYEMQYHDEEKQVRIRLRKSDISTEIKVTPEFMETENYFPELIRVTLLKLKEAAKL